MPKNNHSSANCGSCAVCRAGTRGPGTGNESRSFIRDPDGKITVFDIPGQLFAAGSSYGSGAFAINAAVIVAGRWYDANLSIRGWILLRKGR